MTLALAFHTALVTLVAQTGAALTRPPALRRDLLTFGAAAALSLPVLGLALPDLAVMPSVAPAPVAAEAVSSLGATLQEPLLTAAHAPGPLRWLGWLWAAGVALQGLRLTHALATTWRWRRDAVAPDAAWQAAAREVGLVVSARPELATPVVVPGLRPHVLVPTHTDWSHDRRVRALQHERAHAAARDDLRLVLCQVSCAVHWALPPVWWLRRQLVIAQEQAADAAVVACGADAVRYADDLVNTGRALRGAPWVAALGSHPLEARVRALLRPPPRWSPAARLATTLCVTGSVLGTAAVATAEPHGAPLADVQALDQVVSAELARIEQDWAPEGAAIVVVDTTTGGVVALAELHPGDATTPRTAGSVVKPFVAAAALAAGTAPAQAELAHLLATSDNDGFVAIAEATGPVLAPALRSRGLAAATSSVPEDLALGQFPATTLALAHAYADLPQQPYGRAVVDLLVDAVHSDEGTGRRAAIPGRRVAGKTGTSLLDAGDDTRVLASFVGWLPADDPRWAVAVQVAAPSPRGWGGQVAAPSFGRVARHLP